MLMPADIVNLRQARKTKARVAKEQQADQNRALFGRTKGQKLVEKLDKERAIKTLDGAAREIGSGDE
jgi:Domain of unknown function (DUF4169)